MGNEVLKIFFTRYCDQFCLHCPDSINRHPAKIFITELEVKEKIEQFLAGKLTGRRYGLMITGGEPTLHPKFLKIVDYICSLNCFHIMVVTNGIRLLNEPVFFKQLLKQEIWGMIFSTESSEKDYQELRKINQYEAIWNLIKKIKFTKPHLKLGINLVITPEMGEQFFVNIENLNKYKNYIYVIRVIFLKSFKDINPKLIFSHEEEIEKTKEILKRTKDNDLIKVINTKKINNIGEYEEI